jgi:glucose-6-phosphate 1-dehydrogenase
MDNLRLPGVPQNRLFYMALPSTVFTGTISAISKTCQTSDGFNRFIVEKPFGMDLQSSNELSQQLSALITEEQIFRIDHYLGKGMVQNILMLRFGNVWEHIWNRHSISNVLITFKEDIGTEGRGGYFDSFGIIRDVMQNHLLQVLSLIAMEPPKSTSSEHVRDSKVALLKCIKPLAVDDTIVGQYTGFTKKEPGKTTMQEGYLDDPTVPKGSVTPTFCATVFHINNERWAGVPFVMRAGKALNERKVEVRIQFHYSTTLYGDRDDIFKNELVFRIQPHETVYMKCMSLKPGLEPFPVQTGLDMTLAGESPDAYVRLIKAVLEGDHQHFVRTDELEQAWTIFAPILSHKFVPEPYVFGTRGPASADVLATKYGFVHSPDAGGLKFINKQ